MEYYVEQWSSFLRGRAIRVWEDKPDKTSNIWHLVCFDPDLSYTENIDYSESGLGEDFDLLERRMQHFMGLHYSDSTIENGLERVSIISPPYNKSHIHMINKTMLEMS